jgi:2-polyprenyl-6-methoxyphenol hydroxylase-like FAD-dependent oxidoreductase
VTTLNTRCCIVGGGPAGMMLGFLLARAGVDVVVLEKHKDFLRDFRGDTIHPSTLEIIAELGLLDEFVKLPHQEARTLGGAFGGLQFDFVDFSHLPTRCNFIALMPQWDFLNFIAEHGKRYPGFHLLMQAEATGLIEETGRTVGVRATTPDGALEIRADLVVGCDGRHSTVRALAGMKVDELGAPMDVLWFRLSRSPSDSGQSMGRFEAGRIFVLIDRGDYWQCAYVIPKGSMEDVRRAGLDAFRAGLVQSMPMFADRVGELKDWEQIKLLTVTVDRMPRWHRPGLLCIGDAAHAMSPIGGSASISPCRTRSLPRTFLPSRYGGAALAMTISPVCRSGANSPRASRRGFRCSCRTASSAAHCRRVANCRCRLRCACCRASRCCGAFRPGCWASAYGPSTCTHPRSHEAWRETVSLRVDVTEMRRAEVLRREQRARSGTMLQQLAP